VQLHYKILTQLSLIFGLAFMAGSTLYAEDADSSGLYPKITVSKAEGDKCVRPPAEIRRLHPDMLRHDRIQTMRKGVRAQADGKGLDGSLKACINCHAIKDTKDDSGYVRIDNNEHFCVSCHKFAAVTIDCFQCHRDIPQGDSKPHASIQAIDNKLSPLQSILGNNDLAVISPEVSSNDNK